MESSINKILLNITEDCYIQRCYLAKLFEFLELKKFQFQNYEYYENGQYSLSLKAEDIYNKKIIAIVVKLTGTTFTQDKTQLDKIYSIKYYCEIEEQYDNLIIQIFDFERYLNLTKVFQWYEINSDNYQLVNNFQVKKSNFQIEYQDAVKLGQSISNCANLSALQLDLDQTQINCISIQTILSKTSQCKQLEQLSLNLFKNQISLHSCKVIGSELIKFQNLKNLHLDLQNNMISENDFQWIAKGLQSLQLESLSIFIFQNKAYGQGVSHLGTALSSMNKLQNLLLVLRKCGISSEGLKEFSQGLKNCVNLINFQLHLSQNVLRNGLQYLGQALSKLKKLQYLQLTLRQTLNNDEGLNVLFQGLSNCSNLLNLDIDYGKNLVSQGQIAIKIGKYLSKCQNLRTFKLNIDQNQIDAQIIRNIFKHTTKGKKLTEYYIS
ncbi:hypothetical protein TTHERM_00411960 (macronuclear) [Tetrahymena thermophila SB210]|uniref:Kinase domain protein n=1 Tax=Tetrahymena thermophila (strain SB210) TaxID=312017 RepID=I7LW28_TETTS|nr:hypothetical protein TTHERM_00411960 [Tetrahymena thermophila SB210]EAS00645.3 hypothetical protein TTHERM_00411960 [Tetrahymena thermophila SB210]|eukprot:XP_001020890.3 hypothetical protein TTHERM_00411960 [Tetrahymena thermophila SB210]